MSARDVSHEAASQDAARRGRDPSLFTPGRAGQVKIAGRVRNPDGDASAGKPWLRGNVDKNAVHHRNGNG